MENKNFRNEDLKYLELPLPQEILCYRYSGDFSGEIAALDRWLTKNLPEGMKKRLQFERVLAEGLTRDYVTDFDGVLRELQTRFPCFTGEMLETVIGCGNVDFILKNGKRAFQNDAAANIFKTHPDFLRMSEPGENQRIVPDPEAPTELQRLKRGELRAFRFTVEESLRVRPHAERPGRKIRVWLPYPTDNGTQSEITLLESSFPVEISDAAQRTAYFEKEYCPGDVFRVKFSYVSRFCYREILPEKGEGQAAAMPEFTREQAPHIVFTPLIRSLAAEIAGEEKNPIRLARKVYDWIADNIRYSYLRDYVFIENLPEYVILNRYGDCGAMTLVFVTLLRAMGVPAGWQSGGSARPEGLGSHDWGKFYAEPYGWIYCDLSHGVTEDKERHDYYFGNLDPFRLAAAEEFQSDFVPGKKFLRRDPYDNQNGEAEYEDENLFFGDVTTEKRMLLAEELPG